MMISGKYDDPYLIFLNTIFLPVVVVKLFFFHLSVIQSSFMEYLYFSFREKNAATEKIFNIQTIEL